MVPYFVIPHIFKKLRAFPESSAHFKKVKRIPQIFIKNPELEGRALIQDGH